MKEINLKEILQKHFTKEFGHDGHGEFMSYITDAMKEACDQTADLCAENAETEDSSKSAFAITPNYRVSKDSILNTKDQIK